MYVCEEMSLRAFDIGRHSEFIQVLRIGNVASVPIKCRQKDLFEANSYWRGNTVDFLGLGTFCADRFHLHACSSTAHLDHHILI